MGKSRGAFAAQDQIGGESQNSCNDRDLRIPEAVIEAVVARAEAPTGGGEREAPEGGARQRQDRVAPEPDAEDSCGDRDERPDDGSDPPEEDGPVVVAVEPA